MTRRRGADADLAVGPEDSAPHAPDLPRRVVALLVLVVLAACGPAGPPPPNATDAPASAAPWFEEVAERSGIRWTHRSGHEQRHLLPEIMGGGAALFDMDGDGDLDLYLVQSGSVTSPSPKQPGNRLFRNRGDGTFDDVTEGSGTEVAGYGMGAAAGDYDNDGDVDLFVTNLGADVLLRNDGVGHFTDVTQAAGISESGWSTSAAFLDYDADGDLDLFVLHYINWSPASELSCFSLTGLPDYCSPKNYDAPLADTLFRNSGHGTFTDVSAEAGLHAAFGNGLGLVAADLNRDGRPDVFVANDGMPNQLWMNMGRGRFRDEAMTAGVAVDQDGLAKAGMGVHAIDLDGDGDLDLLVVNLDGESDSFFRNQGSYFTDDTVAVGLRTASRRFTRFGAGLVDFNNDGLLDLFEATGRVGLQAERFSSDPYAEPSLLFRGVPAGRFEEAIPRGGTLGPLIATSRAAAFGDLDQDGGVDIVVVNREASPFVLRNVVKNRGHWIGFRVVDAHGRDAYGATIDLIAGERRITREVGAAYSYLASNDPRVHVGLGPETSVREVRVRWPDGRVDRFGEFAADRYVTLRRAGK
ncbi:MAG: CRTAC1 family protein [Acidobacteria bacterium]|nr:CRTAC1 family protein [Acidobacteriota bacterium]